MIDLDDWWPVAEELSQKALQHFLSEGHLEKNTPANTHLAEIFARLNSVAGTKCKYLLLSAPLGFLNEGTNGWNATCLPNGTVIFNYDLAIASHAVASSYVRWKCEPQFPFYPFLQDVVYKLTHGIATIEDVPIPVAYQTNFVNIYFGMLAFVAGHEIAHFARYHTLKSIGFGQIQSKNLRAAFEQMRLSQEFELEADVYSLNYLARTNVYQPSASLVSLYLMQVLAAESGVRPSPADTHPAIEKRFQKAQQWLTGHNYQNIL